MAWACVLPASVSAIPSGPSGVPRVINIEAPLPTTGVLIFEHDAGSGPPLDETIQVQDVFGKLIHGSVEPPMLDGVALETSWPGLWVFRPAAPLAPSTLFLGVARNTSTDERGIFDFDTLEENPPREASIDSFSVELHAIRVDRSEASECCTRDDAQPGNCFAPEFLRGPELRIAIDASDADPWLGQLLFSATVSDQPVLAATAWTARGLPPIVFSQLERAAEYCVQIDVYDAPTRSKEQLGPRCVADDEALFAGTIPKTAVDLAGSLVAAGCHQPPAGFEAQWCEANQGTCFLRDAFGCQHFGALCPGYAREPATAESADAGEGEPAAARTSSGGCAVAHGSRRAGPCALLLALAPIALLAVRARRRIGCAQ